MRRECAGCVPCGQGPRASVCPRLTICVSHVVYEETGTDPTRERQRRAASTPSRAAMHCTCAARTRSRRCRTAARPVMPVSELARRRFWRGLPAHFGRRPHSETRSMHSSALSLAAMCAVPWGECIARARRARSSLQEHSRRRRSTPRTSLSNPLLGSVRSYTCVCGQPFDMASAPFFLSGRASMPRESRSLSLVGSPLAPCALPWRHDW